MMDVECRTGAEAIALLDDDLFMSGWASLWQSTPGRNVSLNPVHARIWYEEYRDQFDPCLIFALADGDLKAIVPLAIQGTKITGVGANQAEYHGWLASSDDGEFLPALLELLDRRFPRHVLRLIYLQPELAEANIGALAAGKKTRLIEHPRPMRNLVESEIQASLKKKSNRSRINRLGRSGELSFRRVTDTATQVELLQQLAPLYDFRQEAVNGTAPFNQDPKKLSYHLKLIEQLGEFLHFTGMWLDDELVAAHLGFIADDCVQVAILCHSPVFATHSPGRLHMLFVLKLMQEEGFRYLDLTPGGDAWKELLSSSADTVYELSHHTSALQGRVAAVSEVLDKHTRNAVRRLGIDTTAFKRVSGRARRIFRRDAPKKILTRLWSDVELRVYSLRSSGAHRTDDRFRRNSLEDLLRFEAIEDWHDKPEFLLNATRRLEKGEVVYSHADDERLLSFGWLIPNAKKALFSEVKQGMRFPAGSVVLYDAYTHPASRGMGLHKASLNQRRYTSV
jgi:CelD/BcsL family acetyltransferase involved in cellulose biosynthesis